MVPRFPLSTAAEGALSDKDFLSGEGDVLVGLGDSATTTALFRSFYEDVQTDWKKDWYRLWFLFVLAFIALILPFAMNGNSLVGSADSIVRRCCMEFVTLSRHERRSLVHLWGRRGY